MPRNSANGIAELVCWLEFLLFFFKLSGKGQRKVELAESAVGRVCYESSIGYVVETEIEPKYMNDASYLPYFAKLSPFMIPAPDIL